MVFLELALELSLSFSFLAAFLIGEDLTSNLVSLVLSCGSCSRLQESTKNNLIKCYIIFSNVLNLFYFFLQQKMRTHCTIKYGSQRHKIKNKSTSQLGLPKTEYPAPILVRIFLCIRDTLCIGTGGHADATLPVLRNIHQPPQCFALDT